MPVAVAQLVEQLDQILEHHGQLLRLLAGRLGQRRGHLDQFDGQCLLALAALYDPEFDPLTGLECGHSLGQDVRAHVDVAPAVLGDEAKAFLCVIETHLAAGHRYLTRPGDARWRPCLLVKPSDAGQSRPAA